MNKSASLSILQRGVQDSCGGFYCPAGPRLLQQNPYTPASSFPPMHPEQLRKAASQCWEGTSSSSASAGQRSKTCPECANAPRPPLLPALPAEASCSLWPLARGQGQASSHVAPQRHPVLSQSGLSMLGTELGLQSLALRSLVMPYLVGDCSPAAWQVSPAPVMALISGLGGKGCHFFSWKMHGMFQVAV